MVHLSGMIAFMLSALCVNICAFYWPRVATILWTAFACRAGAALFSFYVTPLPESGGDALVFEQVAWEWAQGGLAEAWAHFTRPNSYFISWIIVLVYSVMGRGVLLAQSLSVLMGTATVFLGWLLVRELWGERIAARAGWVLALFPTLILYSAVILREAYISFFVLLGLLGVVQWVRYGRFKAVFLASVGFLGVTFPQNKRQKFDEISITMLRGNLT